MPVDVFFYTRLSMSLNFRGHHRPCSGFSDVSLGGSLSAGSRAPVGLVQAAFFRRASHRRCISFAILARPAGVCVQCNLPPLLDLGDPRWERQRLRAVLANLARPAGVWLQWTFGERLAATEAPRTDSSSFSNSVIRSFRTAACRSCAGVSCNNSITSQSGRAVINAIDYFLPTSGPPGC
jgi:hypothetical protein